MLTLVFLIGFSALTVQVIFLRELTVVFYGNELSFSAILANWFFFGGLGAIVGGFCCHHIKRLRKWLGALLLLFSFSLPLILYATRISRNFLHLPQGEVIGVSQIYVIAAFILAIPAFLLSLLFTLATDYARREVDDRAIPTRCYLYEAAGSGTAGLLLSFFLLWFFNSFETIGFVSALATGAGCILAFGRKKGMLMGTLATFLFLWVVPTAQNTSLASQWSHFTLIASENSPYGNLIVAKEKNQISFFENGLLLSSVPNPQETESLIHPALALHPNPERVLIIGESSPAPVGEALKHPVKSLVAVELDPTWIRLKHKFIPSVTSLKSPNRLRLIDSDGRKFIKSTPEQFDVIIVALPEPSTLMINRFYTSEFFNEAKARLAPGGILALQLPGMVNYPSRELLDLIASIKSSLDEVFQHTVILALEATHLLATDLSARLSDNADDFIAPLKARNINTLFFNENYLPFSLTADRQKQISDALRQIGTVPSNRDGRPIAQFFSTLYWSAYASPRAKAVLTQISRLPEILWFVIPVLWTLIFLILRRAASTRRLSVLNAMCWTGFGQIAFELVLILAYQSIFGYVYLWIAVLMACFMIGMVAGSALTLHRKTDQVKLFRELNTAQFLTVFYPIILIIFLQFLIRGNAAFDTALKCAFLVLAILSGFLGGWQFPLIQRILAEDRSRISRATGIAYGVDLLGSCLGALLIGYFLIPVLGVIKVCLLLSLINLMSWLVLRTVKSTAEDVSV